MRKLLVAVSFALAMLATGSPAAAQSGGTFTCNGVVTGQTLGSVVVPPNGACTLLNSVVRGNVRVLRNAYFQATGTRIRGSVDSIRGLTILIDGGSSVGGVVEAARTFQVFLFDSRIAGGIGVVGSRDKVHICGNRVGADVEVRRSGRDILVGDPLAVKCRGNVVRGSVEVAQNFVDVELVVRGNTVRDDLKVSANRGPAKKVVQDNTGGAELSCKGNRRFFVASVNTGWDKRRGQCGVPARGR
jgi:hypothetical protein